MKLYGIQIESLYLFSADPGIMGEGLMGKELSEKPDAIENLTEFLLSI